MALVPCQKDGRRGKRLRGRWRSTQPPSAEARRPVLVTRRPSFLDMSTIHMWATPLREGRASDGVQHPTSLQASAIIRSRRRRCFGCRARPLDWPSASGHEPRNPGAASCAPVRRRRRIVVGSWARRPKVLAARALAGRT
ncbi:hypothetical protein A7982_12760 [Minicystis rosea]|nr:hypothetical protein A7982_12760 [Minicystis rosea]